MKVTQNKSMKHIVSFSGGKDSTAMLLMMLERGMTVDEIVFADTKYEFPDMYLYLDKVELYIQENYGKQYFVTRLRTEETLEKWMFGNITRGKLKGQIRGFPPVIHGCYWQRESKAKMLDKYSSETNIQYIGIAVEESHRRLKERAGRNFRYPLVEWKITEKDCLQYLKDKDLLNPLYNKFSRLGCWWCPKQKIRSLRVLYNDYPELWKQLCDMFNRVKANRSNATFRIGKTLEELEQRFRNENRQPKLPGLF